jgi:hypothetical protein
LLPAIALPCRFLTLAMQEVYVGFSGGQALPARRFVESSRWECFSRDYVPMSGYQPGPLFSGSRRLASQDRLALGHPDQQHHRGHGHDQEGNQL